jgi:error-prone DNA polymerase
MAGPAYAELHLHTAFSFLDGASLPEEVVATAADLGYEHLAITDHDGLYGAMEFARAARAAGITPLTGAELTLADGSHLTLLAESAAGYSNLCRLITAAHGGPTGLPGDAAPVRTPLAAPEPNGATGRRGALVFGEAGGQKRSGRAAGDPAINGRANEESTMKGATNGRRRGDGRYEGGGGVGRARGGEAAGGARSGGAAGTAWGTLVAGGDEDESGVFEAPDRRQPRLDPALLPLHAEGLILLTGCRQGRLSGLVAEGQAREADRLLGRYAEWFGRDNVFVELQHNLVFGDTDRVRGLAACAGRAGLPTVATGNVHYHRRDRSRLQDVLTAIRCRTTLDGSHRERRPNAEWFLRPPEEQARRFRQYPDAIAATREIAERCARFDLSRDLAYVFPRYPTDPGDTPDALLARVCWEAMAGRYPGGSEAAAARLAEELRLIAKHKLAGFFLLYRDLLGMATEVAAELRGAASSSTLPPGRGRGSSVSSIVCYLFGLSHIDPLAHDLMPGRFINEELSSVPDIDIDFPREIREKLIERVYARYGADHAAMVCAFPTYRLRSAVRDVGKALGLPAGDLDRIAKLSEPRSAKELGVELTRIPAFAARMDAPPWKHLVELAGELAGFPRHVSQHSGGMIVSSAPLTGLVPVLPTAMPGRFICQWDKDSCDDAGFVKIDFLALGMLSLVEECMHLIAANGKAPVDLSRIDFTDTGVFDMICAGDTVGTFQIESRAQIQTILRTQPRSLEDLIVQVAIVRPGPIIGGAVNPYVKLREQRRKGIPAEPVYDHESLEPVLKETLGVTLYQEQVIGVSMAFAGFTAGQADQLRRAMTRKRSHEAMGRMWEQFRDGARAKHANATDELAKTVFEKLIGFASYGFPKCHSAAFAVLAYQSAWLKRYYPAEFACALLNNQPMGFYPPHVLVNDAKRHGIRTMPPDFNRSGAECTVEGNAVRIGLGYVADVGEEAARRIEAERATNGPFESLADLIRRVPLRIEAAENLTAVGAADCFGLGRREALWLVGLLQGPRAFGGNRTGKEKEAGAQLSLALPATEAVELSSMGPWEQMATDYATMGLSPRYHPLGLLRTRLPAGLATVADLERLPDGLRIRLAGLVVCRQRPGTAKGITFLLLEDERGMVNVVVFPDLYEERRHVVRGEPFLVVEGILQKRNDTINLVAEAITPLEEARRQDLPAPPPSDADIAVIVARAGRVNREDTDMETGLLRTIAPASHNYR